MDDLYIAVRGLSVNVTKPAEAAAATGPNKRGIGAAAEGAWGVGATRSLRKEEGRTGPERPMPVAVPVPKEVAGLSGIILVLNPAHSSEFTLDCFNLDPLPKF